MSATESMDTLDDLIERADNTGSSSAMHSYVRLCDDRPAGAWAVVPGCTTHRESPAIDRSNRRVILADLHERFGEVEIIERAGHWAVGWVETVLVPVDDHDGPLAAWLVQWADRLDIYPVASDDDWSELEFDEWCEWWDTYGARETCESDGRKLRDDLPNDWAGLLHVAMVERIESGIDYDADASLSPYLGDIIDVCDELGFFVA